ncbi:DUF695 domain-containing protein [Duganella aceris]|uniref:DUF695 domain-containing protein n=1 Tax=Duganella aceris TaxID=2703883 RepID=A0ABX0FVC2_9BURK|nr:DUF695 domain-containing protein [Duganella aceris]NGZ88630.1 DUF695 domain-containing protein [Duganella aceris]
MNNFVPATDQVEISIPDEVEELFNVRRDGLPEVIAINEGLLSFPHHSIFPWYLCITLEAQYLIDNGMPSPRESELLFEMVDELSLVVMGGRTMSGSVNALFLARSTWNGKRELYYYVHDPKVVHGKLQQALNSKTWHREWSYRMEFDKEWEKATYIFQVFPQASGLSS